MPLQLVQAFFGGFVLVGIIVIFYLITARNLANARRSMSTWRDDYWFYFIAANGWISDRGYKFLLDYLGLTKKDADFFVHHQKRWAIELAVSMLVFFSSTAAVADWVGKHLSK
jgi:hypothetical protein